MAIACERVDLIFFHFLPKHLNSKKPIKAYNQQKTKNGEAIMKKAILILVLFTICAMVVSALTVTIGDPAASGVVTGTYNFTVTLTGHDLGSNVSGCTWATTADGVFAIQNNTNLTSYYNDTVTTSLTETASTTLTVSCYNETSGELLGSTTRTIGVDNTDPVCACSMEREVIELFGKMYYDCAESSDTTTIAYSCVTTYDDATTETETDEYGYFEDTFAKGEASTVCTLTDLVNKTCTSTFTTMIKGSGTAPVAEEEKKKENIQVIALILVIAIIAVIIFTTLMKKGKRK